MLSLYDAILIQPITPAMQSHLSVMPYQLLMAHCRAVRSWLVIVFINIEPVFFFS